MKTLSEGRMPLCFSTTKLYAAESGESQDFLHRLVTVITVYMVSVKFKLSRELLSTTQGA